VTNEEEIEGSTSTWARGKRCTDAFGKTRPLPGSLHRPLPCRREGYFRPGDGFSPGAFYFAPENLDDAYRKTASLVGACREAEGKMYEQLVSAIIKPSSSNEVPRRLTGVGVSGLTVKRSSRFSAETGRARPKIYRGAEVPG